MAVVAVAAVCDRGEPVLHALLEGYDRREALSQLRQDVQGDAVFCCHAVLSLC